jgi:hypothetical protein
VRVRVKVRGRDTYERCVHLVYLSFLELRFAATSIGERRVIRDANGKRGDLPLRMGFTCCHILNHSKF